VVEVERRIVEGTPARVEMLRPCSQGDGVINTAYIEGLNATFRAHPARWRAMAGGAGMPYPDAARGDVLGEYRL
jgi:hypothetical protein